jgi:diguanylate cyclase (GGDEF)-like protein
VDLDDFKPINDTLGHAVGDTVLQGHGARPFVGAVRQVDTVARLAGDEFTVLCENVDSAAAAEQHCARQAAAWRSSSRWTGPRQALWRCGPVLA